MVADEQHREPAAGQLVDGAEQVAHLLRHQDGGGLVEDEDARAAIEHLQDLDALALAHPEVLDQRVGPHAEAVGLRDLVDARAGGAEVQPQALARLAAEDDVLEHGEVVGEHEVLVHHADPGRDGLRRRPQRHDRAVDGDRPLVGALHAVQDLHQRRLAGTVLTDDRVDAARPDADVDVAVGHDAREALGDAGEPHRDQALPAGWTRRHGRLLREDRRAGRRTRRAGDQDPGATGTLISPLMILAL